jgi:hypothetical protein
MTVEVYTELVSFIRRDIISLMANVVYSPHHSGEGAAKYDQSSWSVQNRVSGICRRNTMVMERALRVKGGDEGQIQYEAERVAEKYASC